MTTITRSKDKFAVISAIVFVILAISIGAFAAHGLKSILSAYHLDIVNTASEYLMYSGIGLLALSVANHQQRVQNPSVSYVLIIVGTIIFCTSLLLLVFFNAAWFGMLTPIGGTLMITGWIIALIKVIKSK